MMQNSGQRQSPHNLPVGTTNNCTFGSPIHSRAGAKPTNVLATPIQRTAAVPSNAVIFSTADCPGRPVSPRGRISHDIRDLAEETHPRPDCSYSLLVGMALKSSKSGALPVNEMYKYIQREFPYFRQAVSETWKNCVRHSLSLGRFFRKVQTGPGTETKKGFYWEIVPSKKADLDKEVERFMKKEGYQVIIERIENEASDAATSTLPPYLRTVQEQGSVMISSPSVKNSLKQASVTQNDTPKQGSVPPHNITLGTDTFIASNVAVNKAILLPLSNGLHPSSSTTSRVSCSTMTYQELPASSTIPMDYILMKTLAEGATCDDTTQDQFSIKPQQSAISLASGLEVTTPTSPWPDFPEELLSILPQCPSVTSMNNVSDLERAGLGKCTVDCDCSTCKVRTPAFLQCSGKQILRSVINMPSSTTHHNTIPCNESSIVIDLTSPMLSSPQRKCRDAAAILSIKPTKPIPLQLQYYNTNLHAYFANSTTCTPLPVNVHEPASINLDRMVSAGRTAVNLENLADTCSLQSSVFEVEKLDEKKGANQLSSQHKDLLQLTCTTGRPLELRTSTSSCMLSRQQHKNNSAKSSGSRDATSASSSATLVSSTGYTSDPQKVSLLSSSEQLENLSTDELVKLIEEEEEEEEELSRRQRIALLNDGNRKQRVQNSRKISLASVRGAPIASGKEELRSSSSSATDFKPPSCHADQNFKKRRLLRLEEEHNYCTGGFRKPEQNKKRCHSAGANFFDCSMWKAPVYTEEWIDHPLSTENTLTLLEETKQTEAKRGSSAGKQTATSDQQACATGMSVSAIAAGLPSFQKHMQESLDELQKEEEEGQ